MKSLLLILSMLLISESGSVKTFRFGKISQEEWEINKCSFDSSAKAAVLFDEGDMKIIPGTKITQNDPDSRLSLSLYNFIYERHIRIKVFNNWDGGPEFFNIRIRSENGKKDKLSYFKGVLLSLNENKEIKRKIKLQQLKVKVNKDGSEEITLAPRDIKAGSIIEIEYSIESSIFNEAPDWNFGCKYPVFYSALSLSFPDFFVFQKKCTDIKNLAYKSYSKPEKYNLASHLNGGLQFLEYNYWINNETYTLKDIPGSANPENWHSLKYITTSVKIQNVPYTRSTMR